MSVTRLPHEGEYVQIDLRGIQTIFGWTAKDSWIRPPAPEGKTYAEDDDRDGWEMGNTWKVASIAAVASAYRREHGAADPKIHAIRVSPELGAQLRANKDIYGRSALLSHQVIQTEAGPVVRIPLGESCQWKKEVGIQFIDISPAYTGVSIADEHGNEL